MEDDFVRDSFAFYRSFEEAINSLDDNSQLSLYRAICRFSLYGEEPEELEGVGNMAWRLIEPLLAKSRVRSFSVKQRTSYRGGAPIGNKNAEKQQRNNNETTTKQQQNNSKIKSNIKIESNIKSSKEDINTFKEEIKEEEKKFLEGMEREYPHLCEMEEPLTYDQWMRLADAFPKEAIMQVLSNMENRKGLEKANRSCYRTARNWLRNTLKNGTNGNSF